MKMWKIIVPAAALLLLAVPAAAQNQEEDERLRAMETRERQMEERLRAAEEAMAEAAREIAEISQERLPRVVEIEKRFAMSSRPRLGVTIESTGEDGPVEGVTLLGVTPGSAASEAGLRSGDIMTSINSEALSADSNKAANMRLLDFMGGVEEGDILTIEYLRDGKVGSVELEPRVVDDETWAWSTEGKLGRMHKAPHATIAPEMIERFSMQFGFPWAGTGLGDMELVELNEGLGKYFGTDKGLLVVEAPESDVMKLKSGDVIQSIDGREPKDVRHALRILGSYQPGEKLKIGIMRNKKKLTVDIEIPSDQQGSLAPGFDIEILPAMAPGGRVPLPELVEAPAFVIEIES